MNIKTVVLLCILYSIVLLNMTWGCCISPSIEAMQNPNLKQLIKANIKNKKNPYI
jgi:hypothetical protein